MDFRFGISAGKYELIIVLSVSMPFYGYMDGRDWSCIERVMAFGRVGVWEKTLVRGAYRVIRRAYPGEKIYASRSWEERAT